MAESAYQHRRRLVAALLLVAPLTLGGAGCGSTNRSADPPVSRSSAAASSSPIEPAASPSASLAPTPAAAAPSPTTRPTVGPIVVPAGVTAGIAVYDRTTGTFLVQQHVTATFRSASLVKLLIALDYLWDRGPTYAVPETDRARLDLMLRSSDDAAASYYWKLAGTGQVVRRMITRLGLVDSAPPPPNHLGWGYTALSAADVVRIYRYILETAPAPVRTFIMGDLHRSTRCGSDGYDQSFGIPSAFAQPWAAKQGWSGFGTTPATRCTANAAMSSPSSSAASAPAALDLRPAAIDVVGEVLHTTGTVGAGDRWIIAVLTLNPDGSRFATASAGLTRMIRSIASGLPSGG
jgi:hypothetical protein